MKPFRHDLTCYKGQTYDQNIFFRYKKTKAPVDLSGISAKAQVRPSPNSAYLTTSIHCTVYAEEGKINLALDADESALLKPGFYAWDLQMTDDTGVVVYSIEGQFIVTGRVTV